MASRLPAERGLKEFVRLGHRGLDRTVLFEEAADLLRKIVPFDGACWHTLDPATLLITSHVTDLDGSGFPFICRNEYLQADVNKFSVLGRLASPVGVLSDAARGEPLSSARYREIFNRRGWSAEMRGVFRLGSTSWGAVMLLRARGRSDFNGREAAFLATISKVLAHGIRTSLLHSPQLNDMTQPAPGLILLGPRDEIEATTPPTGRWLEELCALDSPRGHLPAAVKSVAARARTAGGRRDGELRPAIARVQTPSGQWLLLHGSRLEPASDERIAVVIEVAGPAEIAPVIAAAYDLSNRERAVIQRVLQGFSTNEIAHELCLSPYTVQDHFKMIFDKVGVRSRRELVGQVFYQHYQPRLEAAIGPGQDGWFSS